MGKLFDLVEAYRGRFSPHEPSYSRVAEQVGVSRQTLLNWQAPTKLIDKEHLLALAELTDVPYQRILDALLDDIGYLREEQVAVVAARRNAKRKPQGPRVQEAD
jgi:transcriptional regulator with XRE-family HTH domain